MRFPKQFITDGALAQMRDLTGGDLRVLLVLIAEAGEDAAVSITQTELANLAGMARKSVRNCIDRLAARGVIRRSSTRGRTSEFVVLPSYEMAPTRAIRVPTYAQGVGTLRGANYGAELAPSGVPTPKSPLTRVPNSPPGTSHHPHEDNARRAFTELVSSSQLPLSVDALIAHAYRAGGGDPWKGYLALKPVAIEDFGWASNPAAALESKLRKVGA